MGRAFIARDGSDRAFLFAEHAALAGLGQYPELHQGLAAACGAILLLNMSAVFLRKFGQC